MIKYAGIGSRQTPVNVLPQMQMVGTVLASKGFMLRSGRAPGADQSFEAGCDVISGPKLIRVSTLWQPALDHAALFHPAWHKCDEYTRAKHARNSLIVCGDTLNDPVDFIACWTPHAEPVGGTGQALRIAATYGIPVFNMFDDPTLTKMYQWIGERGL